MKKSRIDDNKIYYVTKDTTKKSYDYGTMCGKDVKLIIKNFRFDKEFTEVWNCNGTYNDLVYSRKCTLIFVKEV